MWIPGNYEWRRGAWTWKAGRYERRQRNKRFQPGRWDLQGNSYVWIGGRWDNAPTEPDAPPPPIEERPKFRRGFTWIAGHWNWQDGSYEWIPGRLERRKTGKRWLASRWEQLNGRWTFSVGAWTDSPSEPNYAPPPPPTETARPRRGHVWVAGNYEWRNGDYEWVPGRYERVRANQRWAEARWENSGNRWTYTPGSWQDGSRQDSRPWSFDSRGWTLLGEKVVEGRNDTGQVDFSQKKGTVSKLVIVVIDSDLEMDDLAITFVNGKGFRPTGRHFFRENSRTRAIDLPNGEILRAINFKYSNLPGGGRARVQVWAKP